MRIWSLHPSILDTKALVAGWREALGAQAVFSGQTKGYSRHPQLNRFKEVPEPLFAMGYYLTELAEEAKRRGYKFNETKIICPCKRPGYITVTTGQLDYELKWLRSKVTVHAPDFLGSLPTDPIAHSLFKIVQGGVESWEIVKEVN